MVLWRLVKGGASAAAATTHLGGAERLVVSIDGVTLFSCAFPQGSGTAEIAALAVTARREFESRGWSAPVTLGAATAGPALGKDFATS